jgi:hypothetical protein
MTALYKADDRALLTSVLTGEGVHPSLARESRGSARGAIHNSHHLGQVIAIRRLMGLWPRRPERSNGDAPHGFPD